MEQAMIQPIVHETAPHAGHFSSVVDELAHYRQQTRRLTLINELHTRLLSASDLQGMVEAFSVWLMPLVEHDLIAYSNEEKNKHHVFCSCHGTDRRTVLSVVEQSLAGVALEDDYCEKISDYQIHTWKFKRARGGAKIAVVFQEGKIDAFHSDLLREAVAILDEPLQRVIAIEDLYLQARQDSLTGLANRRVLDERIGSMIETARRYKHPLSMLSMDLDRFKLINDSLGHAAGDKVLQQVATLMAEMIRKSDLLVRIGGDEFVLILPDTALHDAEILAKRLCGAIDGLNFRTPAKKKLGISIGISEWKDNLTAEQWLRRVDEVLYAAKDAGRGRAVSEKN